MNNRKRLILTGALGFFLVFIMGVFLDARDGAEIFRKEGCSNCHSFKGQGGSTAPDLTAVSQRRNDSWIRTQIKNSKKHNPASMMPEYSHLSWQEVNALVMYLKN